MTNTQVVQMVNTESNHRLPLNAGKYPTLGYWDVHWDVLRAEKYRLPQFTFKCKIKDRRGVGRKQQSRLFNI